MNQSSHVLLAHGGGGTLMHTLIRDTIAAKLKNPVLQKFDDSAILAACRTAGRIAFTTDSYVVKPLFFSGGDIGKLAVSGTVNDLAMQGAKPVAISLSFIIEEGFPLADLQKIVISIARTAKEARSFIATGDVKVVQKGGADGLFVNTSGIGFVPKGVNVSSHNAKPGDAIIINGFIADHGISIMCEREGLKFQTQTRSDCAPLAGLVGAILGRTRSIHCMKDPTRGGIASALNEIAQNSEVSIEIDESEIPIRESTFAACEMLGLDPLIVANEGKVLVVCPQAVAPDVVRIMRKHRYGKAAKIIGSVTGKGKQEVILKTAVGGSRIVDMPYGELLPRIC
jgi:hydrogenase expression/formation protein HypE